MPGSPATQKLRVLTHEQICARLQQSVKDGGPCKRSILELLAHRHGSLHPIATVDGMIEDGTLTKFGSRRGQRLGMRGFPGLARPAPRRRTKVIRG